MSDVKVSAVVSRLYNRYYETIGGQKEPLDDYIARRLQGELKAAGLSLVPSEGVLLEKIADMISEAAQTKGELLSDKETSVYRHGWQSGFMAALEEVRNELTPLPTPEEG